MTECKWARFNLALMFCLATAFAGCLHLPEPEPTASLTPNATSAQFFSWLRGNMTTIERLYARGALRIEVPEAGPKSMRCEFWFERPHYLYLAAKHPLAGPIFDFEIQDHAFRLYDHDARRIYTPQSLAPESELAVLLRSFSVRHVASLFTDWQDPRIGNTFQIVDRTQCAVVGEAKDRHGKLRITAHFADGLNLKSLDIAPVLQDGKTLATLTYTRSDDLATPMAPKSLRMGHDQRTQEGSALLVFSRIQCNTSLPPAPEFPQE